VGNNIWRKLHFILAAIAAIFLFLATISGAILALEPIYNTMYNPTAAELDQTTLAEFIPTLNAKYDAVLELTVTDNKEVKVTTFSFDEEGSSDFFVHPKTAEKSTVVYQRPKLFEWMTNFHRSLFLKTTGRLFVGVCALLLLLIGMTGFALALRKLGWKKFVFPFQKEEKHPYYHTYFGRIGLLPILIVAITGVVLSLVRFDVLDTKTKVSEKVPTVTESPEKIPVSEFKSFQDILLKDVKKMEYPFSDDPTDFYTVYLKRKELQVNHHTGAIIKSEVYPAAKALQILSFELHTGSFSVVWAIVLCLTCFGIFYFMYSGFSIATKRLQHGLQENTVSPEQAELVMLVGSESGKTTAFANVFLSEVLRLGVKAFMTTMNNYQSFPKMKDVVIFTATYGDGDPPASAIHFTELFKEAPQKATVTFSVLGFGSTNYEKFCQFAKDIDALLGENSSFKAAIPLALVNKGNYRMFKTWADAWSSWKGIELQLPEKLPIGKEVEYEFSIGDRAEVFDGVATLFNLELHTKKKRKFEAGDLIAVVPNEQEEPRYYSVGKNKKGNLVLSIKKQDDGLVSNQLYHLGVGETFTAAHVVNAHFHFPLDVPKVILIANGTGIAPFLGMMHFSKEIETELYWGVRTKSTYDLVAPEINDALNRGTLNRFHLALSQEESAYDYVQNMIARHAATLNTDLKNGATLMICGSLAMQKAVFEVLDAFLEKYQNHNLKFYLDSGRILSDCY